MRPIVHTFGSFLVERAFEQIKLGFGHQDVGGVLVGGLGSFDSAGMGRTHQTTGDVALMDTLSGAQIHAPSTSAEVDAVVRRAVAGDGLHYVRVVGQTNSQSFPAGGFHVVRRGSGATVIALGPVLDAALAATEGLDVTVLYAHTVRPFDARGAAGRPRYSRRRPGRALAGRHLLPRRRRRPARRTAPPAVARRHAIRAAPLRHPGRPRPRPRPRRRRHPPRPGRVPGRRGLTLAAEAMGRVPDDALQRVEGHTTRPRCARTSMWPRSGTPGRGRCSSVGRAPLL